MRARTSKKRPSYDCPALEATYHELRPGYERLLAEIQKQLKLLLEAAGLSVTIKYRLKRFDNFCEKLIRQRKQSTDKDVCLTDLLGVRIVCPFLEDLEHVERIIARSFEILEMEHKAEQHSFREFGYDSVHILIKTPPLKNAAKLPYSKDVCEIQLRTILQEAWAEVEHELVYKSDIAMPNHSIRRKLASLNASLTLSDLVFQEIRDYQKEIRQRGLKRRQSVEPEACACGSIQISQLPELKQVADAELENFIPEQVTSKKLEKLMLAALEAHSNNAFPQAIDIYSTLLRMKLEPAIRSLVYNHRGMALFALSEYQKGVEDFSKAIEFNEENFRAWSNRGLAYRVLGKMDQSLEDYNRVVEIHPQQYEGYWGRAQTCYEMKLYSRALDDCRSTLQRKADFTPAQDLEKVLHRLLF